MKKPSDSDEDLYRRRRKTVSLCSFLLFVVILCLLTLFFTKRLAPYMGSSEELHAFLAAYGWKGRFILFGLQFLQVVVALIPGEVVELGAGYAYGALEGTLICLAGVAVSSSVIFLLTKKLGTPMVEAFIPREKIRQLRFINSEKKLKRLVFLLFLIPGTPKDILTYFVGLTDLRLLPFLSLTLVARIPSVLSSTICGQILGHNDYLTAAIVYAITGAVSILGYWLYTKILQRNRRTTTDSTSATDQK